MKKFKLFFFFIPAILTCRLSLAQNPIDSCRNVLDTKKLCSRIFYPGFYSENDNYEKLIYEAACVPEDEILETAGNKKVRDLWNRMKTDCFCDPPEAYAGFYGTKPHILLVALREFNWEFIDDWMIWGLDLNPVTKNIGTPLDYIKKNIAADYGLDPGLIDKLAGDKKEKGGGASEEYMQQYLNFRHSGAKHMHELKITPEDYTIVTGKQKIWNYNYLPFFGQFAIGSFYTDNKHLYTFIKRNGETLTPYKYDFVCQFDQNGLALILKDKKIGLLDTTGREVYSPQFSYIDEGKEGVYKVFKDDYCGYITPSGVIVPPNKYRWGSEFKDGKAKVGYNRSGLDSVDYGPYNNLDYYEEFTIDKTGKVIETTRYQKRK